MSFLALEHAGRSFAQPGGAVVALDDVSLSIEQGEFVVVTGDSGSGKTTMLSLLGLMDAPTSGVVIFRGEPVDRRGAAALAALRLRYSGFMFQEFHLLRHLSALDNVGLPALLAGVSAAEARRRSTELLDSVDLSTRREHRPHELSRGEMARVAMARALINQPEVIFADEPTANLDADNSDRIWGILAERHARHGTTVVVATHSRSRLSHATRTVALSRGRVVPVEGQEGAA